MRAASIRLCSPRLAAGVSGPTMLALDARPENAVRLSSVRLAADVSGLTMLALNGQPENAGIDPPAHLHRNPPEPVRAEEQAALRGSAWRG